jgi:hypothetical protein
MRLCGVGNQFADEYVHPRISSLRCLCFVDQFADESVLQRMSSMTSRCFSASFRWRVRASANQFPDESVLQWISSLRSLCFIESVCWRGCVVHWISLLMSMCFTESIPWRVYTSANQFTDEVVWCIKSLRWESVLRRSVCWWVCASPISFLTSLCFADQFPEESVF